MNKVYMLASISLLLGGCLSVTDPELSRWPVEFSKSVATASKPAKPAYSVVRLQQINVRPPYDTEGMLVLRSDKTLALDPMNEFVSSPSLMLRGLFLDALQSCGRFSDVVLSSSSAKSVYAAEILVTRLCLNCCTEGSRRAECEIRFCLLKDREIVKKTEGAAAIDAADGDYGKAFSKAVSTAVVQALEKLD